MPITDRFPDPLDLRGLNPDEVCQAGGNLALWTLLATFSYKCKKFGITITAPVGMTTDFASIPKPVWGLLSPDDPVILFPSVIHDLLYAVKGVLPERTLTRENCDDVLREAMEFCGARSWLRETVYHIVRIGGGKHW